MLLGLGLAGGLSPSPTALLLLLGAVGAGHAWAGVLAVVTFGLGMAAALTAVGLVAAAGRLRLDRWSGRAPRLTALVPRLAGLGVVGGGSLLVARGVVQVVGL
jgi:ABC-type nickel/cobalt efflux system permease component RcnA